MSAPRSPNPLPGNRACVQAGKELLSAAEKGNLAEVRRLLDAGAEVDARGAVSPFGASHPPHPTVTTPKANARANTCMSTCHISGGTHAALLCLVEGPSGHREGADREARRRGG
jgi:hypothetical protein